MNIDATALWLGKALLGLGGIAIMFLLIFLLVDWVGSAFWRKLTALHDVSVLRYHLRKLAAEGRTLNKPSD